MESLHPTTGAIYDILSAVGNSREIVENQTSTGDGGEIPLRAEVGQPFLAKYRNIFKTQTAQGDHSLHGVYLPRALCLPVAGLCKSVWGVTGTPHFLMHGTSPAAARGTEV